jgi:hypothetical protein
MNSKPSHLATVITLLQIVIVIQTNDSIARAQGELGAFGARPSYNNVPDLANPGTFASHIIFYSLPDAQTSTSIYAGASRVYFDLFARVSGDGTLGATGFSLTATLNGDGEIVFDPAPIAGGPNPPRNIPYSLNPSFPQNSSMDIMFGVKNAQGGGDRSFALTALNDVPGTNVTIADGDGLAAIPVLIAGGSTGMFHVNFGADPTFTGFINATGQVVTDVSAFPHSSGLIEIRSSVRGDMNGDGATNQGDVGLFFAAIDDPDGFKGRYPWLQTDYIADFNEDRQIDAGDLPGFQQVVVPEPATVILAIALALVLRLTRRRRLRF